MVPVSVLPVRFLRLEPAFSGGYAGTESLAFYNSEIVQLLLWALPATR